VALKSKIQVRSLVRRLIDDPAGKQWPTSDLDELIEAALDELWGGELLERFPWLTSKEEILTNVTIPALVAPGTLLLSALSQRFYRIQRVVRNGAPYRLARSDEVVLSGATAICAPDNSYAILDGGLWAFPLDATSPLTVRYSYLPEPFTSLSPGPDPDDTADDDISFVPWPDGFHMAYIYDIAAKALERGDKEESDKLQKRADQALFRLKAFLRKQHTGPILAQTSNDEFYWGGV
jgi:hypothetical protein